MASVRHSPTALIGLLPIALSFQGRGTPTWYQPCGIAYAYSPVFQYPSVEKAFARTRIHRCFQCLRQREHENAVLTDIACAEQHEPFLLEPPLQHLQGRLVDGEGVDRKGIGSEHPGPGRFAPSLCLLPFVYQVGNDIVDERFVFSSDPCTREIDESYFSFNALRLVFLKYHGEALRPGHASEVNHRKIERIDPEYPPLVFLTLVRSRVNNRPDATSSGIMCSDPMLQVAGQRASPRSERVRIRKT